MLADLRRRQQTPARLADQVGKGAQKRAQRAARGGAKARRATERALSDALDRVSTALSESLPELAAEGAGQASAASIAARERLADTAEAFAQAIRPRRRRRLLRTGALLVVVVAGVALGTALRRLLAGEQPPTTTADMAPRADAGSAAASAPGNGVAAIRETARRAADRVGEAVVRVRGRAVRRTQEVQSSLEEAGRQL